MPPDFGLVSIGLERVVGAVGLEACLWFRCVPDGFGDIETVSILLDSLDRGFAVRACFVVSKPVRILVGLFG